jgi:hypothetical protein
MLVSETRCAHRQVEPAAGGARRSGCGDESAVTSVGWRYSKALAFKIADGPLLARLRHADVPCECPLIGVNRKWLVDRQNDGFDPQETSRGDAKCTAKHVAAWR